MREIFTMLAIFCFVVQAINVFVGASLCFGPLKWRKNLIAITALGWGAVLGFLIWDNFLSSGDIDSLIICCLIGAIVLAAMAYTVSVVNRFIVGYILGEKLTFMLTTVLAKEGFMDGKLAILLPILLGILVGLILMSRDHTGKKTYILAYTFVGASQVAPTVSDWINRGLFGITGDISFLFDPIDIIYSLFGIEITDVWTFIIVVLLMVLGVRTQMKLSQKSDGIVSTPPIITIDTAEDDDEDDDDKKK